MRDVQPLKLVDDMRGCQRRRHVHEQMHVVRHDLHGPDQPAFHLVGLFAEQRLEPVGNRPDQYGQPVFGAPDDVILEREDSASVLAEALIDHAASIAIGALAAKAEDSGFVRLGVPDLMVVPKSYASRYPYDASGKLVGYSGECMEQLILMTHVAAVTKKIRILSAVMVVPRRPAVFTAKAVATMDRLSGGRIRRLRRHCL